MSTFHVEVSPDVLIWARKRTGLTVEAAAEALDTNSLTIQYWEIGADELAQPTLVQLRKMARLYQVPLAALYFCAPPPENPSILPDYRLLRLVTAPEWSLQMFKTYHRAQLQREVAIAVSNAADEPTQTAELTLHQHDSVEKEAIRIRSWLDVGIDRQLSWTNEYQALNAWIGAVERHGILVAHSDAVLLDEMRGFSLSEWPFPVIVLNGYDKPRGRIFTLLHELAHVLMRTGGLCDLSEQSSKRSNLARIETFCNQIAGAVLLPQEEIVAIAAECNLAGPVLWSDASLSRLSRRYNTSREVALRRLVDFNYAILDDYFAKVLIYNRQYEDEREQERLERERRKREGLQLRRPNPLTLRLRNLGRRYTAEVIQAYGQRHIDAAELSEYLNTKIDHIPAFIDMLEQTR